MYFIILKIFFIYYLLYVGVYYFYFFVDEVVDIFIFDLIVYTNIDFYETKDSIFQMSLYGLSLHQ